MRFLLGFIFFLLITNIKAQKLILTHEPFASKNLRSLSYVKDSIVFDTHQKIWGITNGTAFPNTDKNPVLEVQFKNAYQFECTVKFNLKKFDPSQLNWHASIKAYYHQLLSKNNWYYLSIIDSPSVVDAYQGVALLELFNDIYSRNIDKSKPQQIYYKLANNDEFQTCWVDNGKGKGLLDPLLEKMKHYQLQITKRKQLKKEQLEIEKNCQSIGFAKVAEWGRQQDGFVSKIKTDDLQLFIAIEKMKIITEETATNIRPIEKRLLRELFLLDLSILESQSEYQRSIMNKRRASLFKRITVYPNLKKLVYQYQQLTKKPQAIKVDKRLQEQRLKLIKAKFKPYQAKWNRHKQLQKEIDRLDESLERF